MSTSMYQLTSGDTILRLSDKTCEIPGCKQKHIARGYCKLHYDRVIKTGNPDDTERSILRKLSLQEHFEYFFDKSIKSDRGCIEWAGSRNLNGYGRITKNNKTYFAHRLSYQITFGADPGDKEVCHRCDNPSCVNPEHLFLGTTKDNALDREVKSRGNHESKKRKYTFMSPFGGVVAVHGLTAFCKDNDLSQSKMSEVWLANRKHHKGWTRHV